ncbi:hypothetical protein [Aquimarina rubra]|uniref:Uncharacterized protein n=1 Tax=Aquimarina rubra TaxID=1920033 RepID=A0ABW5LK21_9FLAO
MKNKTSDLLIQIISVTIGVFLGFAISNWSENKKETKKFNSLIENLTSEIQSNMNKIEQVIDYHKTVRDSSRFYLSQKKLNNFKPTFFKGVNTLSFDNSVYQTAIQTGLFNKLKIEKSQAINNIYTKQRAYEEFSNLLLSGLITMDFEQNEKSYRRIATYLSISMTDIVIKETQLLENMEATLKLIN